MESLRKLSLLLIFLAFAVFVVAQNATINGKVMDSAGRGVSGINVLVKGSTKGTYTTADGSLASMLLPERHL